jgi:hypothetical protein
MSWGNKLLVTFIVFAAGMAYLVYRSVSTNYELVEKDYYKSEIAYQQVIDGSNRANQLSTPVKLDQTKEGILLSMPQEMKKENTSGNIWFYCSYNEKKDRKFSLQLDKEGKQLFDITSVPPGNYTVKITWNHDDKDYFTEKHLSVP